MAYGVTGLTDISASLWEKEFGGVGDVNRVISRAWDCGLERIFIVGNSYKTSKQALEISRTDRRLYCTVGCHPSMYDIFKQKGSYDYADSLAGLIEYSKRKCVAVGNFGLNYTEEGLAICEKKDQLEFFDWHVQFGHFLKKPMLFHYRGDAFDDMMTLLTKKLHHGTLRGVCHSFQGPLVHARELIRKGFYIGFDGCSLKEKQNVEAVKGVPLNRLLLGTGSPRCGVLRPHAGLRYLAHGFFPSRNRRFHDEILFGRTEPSHMCQLLEIVATARRMELQELADILQMNVNKLFFTKNNKKPCECESWPIGGPFSLEA